MRGVQRGSVEATPSSVVEVRAAFVFTVGLFGLVGCSSSHHNASSPRPLDMSEVQQRLGIAGYNAGLSCPPSEPATRGHSFDCLVGAGTVIKVTITDDQGNYTFAPVGANTGTNPPSWATSATGAPATSAASQFSQTCVLGAGNKGYHESIANGSSGLVDITGFVTIFYDAAGRQVGSDHEPGNGAVDDRMTILMNDYLAAGQTVAHNVMPDNGVPPTATRCVIAQVEADNSSSQSGGTVLDHTAVEQTIEKAGYTGVVCNGGENPEVKKGATFTCTADGAKQITVTMTDDEGKYTWSPA
jgi:hypothetical protein